MSGGVSDMMASRGKRVEGSVKLSVAEMPAGRERQGAGCPTTWRTGEEKAARTKPLAQPMPTEAHHRFLARG